MEQALGEGQPPVERVQHQFSFTGSGMEYFWICLRTFLLALITLGIYDAWGTVERRRYLCGHTRVAGHGFDYHAKPKTILIGRLIALAIIIAFQAVSALNPIVSTVLVLGLLPAIPWLINRSLRFNLRNTSYRNVRFNFGGSYGWAFAAYLLMPLSLGISLGLTYPLVARAAKEYIVNNASLGKAAFSVRIPLKPLYGYFLVMIGCVIIFFIVNTVVGYGAMYASTQQNDFASLLLLLIGTFSTFGGPLFLMILFYLMYKVIQIVLRNLMFRNMTLEDGHGFNSTLPIWGSIWVVLSSGFLATVTLGLLIPWATVRIHRYEMEHTELLAAGNLDQFVAHSSDAGDAVGAEFGSMEGVTDGLLSGV